MGALALLWMTWSSQREARAVIQSSRALATHTEALAATSKDTQRLAVIPVIEVGFDSHDRRLRLVNKGNGPLLGPLVTVSGKEFALVAQDKTTTAYVQIGAFAVGGTGYALLDSGLTPGDTILITGLTLSGDLFSGRVLSDGLARHAILLAQSDL